MATALSHKLPHVPAEVSKSETPSELRFHLLLLLVAVVLGSLLQVLGPTWFRGIMEQVKLESLGGVAALLAALLVSMIAHELGHLFAALFLNYKVLGAAIGPLRVDWWNHKALFRFQQGNWSRCSISAVPREMRNSWRRRMMIVVSAGPAVSLLFLLAATGVALRGHGAQAEESWLAAFWGSCAGVNFFLFVLGFVPNGRSAPVRNDAALFLSLWRNDNDTVDMFVCHQAIELSLRGIRPEDYPEPVLLELASFEGRRPFTNLMVARRMVEWAADSGNLRLAGEWDQSALAAAAHCSSRQANASLAESACFDVLFREDPRAAVHKFAKVDFDELFPPALAERAQAARLIACGLPHRAPAHILRAQYHLPLGNPYHNYERMLLDKLHARALSQSLPGAQ